ncbi:GAF domain-containing protein [Glaciihabitans sp. INWT7]|uniref:GAF domain-containing protein n=1 Tax=Glaciihabitans sp. INWT7 TaxID=2596912 RepID=UPI00162A9162|nr:GAF domain-containing protein [Glaciihabitans sp. INWT7]QNE47479.1 GAF domain-containing protein [Glaciihabitans sp. INWT7]
MRSRSAAGTEIFIVSMPIIGSATLFPRTFNAFVQRQSRQFTAVTAELVSDDPHSTVIGLDDFETLRSTGTTAAERWASLAAPLMSEVLRRPGAVRHEAVVVDERERQLSLDSLAILDTEPDEAFNLIASIARDLFDVPMAAITFIDDTRQWTKSAVGFIGSVIPRQEAFCNVTIDEPRHFVIEDTRDDARFADGPHVTGPGGVKFYAGYPIEAPDGHRVGALCVMDDAPRRFSDAEAALLRNLALRVQELLWVGARP